jgi:hypothetical protein
MPVCPFCHREFRPNRDWQSFCCREHQQQWHRDQLKQRRRLNDRKPKEVDLEKLRTRAEEFVEPEPMVGEPMRRLI